MTDGERAKCIARANERAFQAKCKDDAKHDVETDERNKTGEKVVETTEERVDALEKRVDAIESRVAKLFKGSVFECCC